MQWEILQPPDSIDRTDCQSILMEICHKLISHPVQSEPRLRVQDTSEIQWDGLHPSWGHRGQQAQSDHTQGEHVQRSETRQIFHLLIKRER